MEDDDKLPESHLMTSAEPPERQTASPHSAAKGQARTWWMMDAPELEADKRSSPGSPSGRLRWNFSTIPFPDLGSTSRPRCMVPVDPSLLPRDVTVGVCDLDSWMRKINLRKVKMSVKEQQREKRRRRWDVNKDREVKSPKGRNKAEAFSVSVDLILRSVRFKDAETGRSTMSCWPGGRRSGKADQLTCGTGKLNLYTTRLSQSPPVSWCWTLAISSESPLKGDDKSDVTALKCSEEWRICFNVYQPDSVADFKKSNPGKPYSRMCVCSFDGPVPDLRVIKQLAFQSGDVPIVYAVVDHGDISFYTFKDFQLPRDVYA
ncbi:hypothetical protein XENOCAPTIV_012979 [Xenoophorus captivus]|uniref:TSEN54 tRNA splicing endonuclease subunit n=1 Tax=Xenoophorus captivus TaxID=1517983 RepID=A0ABV0R0C4_9TELE